MSEIDVFLISFFLCLIINYILPKYNFLIDKKNSFHTKHSQVKILCQLVAV